MSPISKLLIKAFKRFKQKKLQIHEPDINKTDLNNLKAVLIQEMFLLQEIFVKNLKMN